MSEETAFGEAEGIQIQEWLDEPHYREDR